MSSSRLDGRRIAFLATNGVEQRELTDTRNALDRAGASTTLVAPKGGSIQAYQNDQKAQTVEVDVTLAEARADDYDALVLPGGVMNADLLRQNPAAVRFVQDFAQVHKPIGASCHAPWLLVEAGCVHGRTVTSWPSLKTDLENAGATWVDRPVVADSAIVTSRKPEDIPAFSSTLIEEIGEGVHAHAGAGAGAAVNNARISFSSGGKGSTQPFRANRFDQGAP